MRLATGQGAVFRRAGALPPVRVPAPDDSQRVAAAEQAFDHDAGIPLASLLCFKEHLRFRSLKGIARLPLILDAGESLIDAPRCGSRIPCMQMRNERIAEGNPGLNGHDHCSSFMKHDSCETGKLLRVGQDFRATRSSRGGAPNRTLQSKPQYEIHLTGCQT